MKHVYQHYYFRFQPMLWFFFKNNHFLNLLGVKWPQNEAIHLSAFESVLLHKAFSNTYLNTVIGYSPSLHYHYVFFLVLVLVWYMSLIINVVFLCKYTILFRIHLWYSNEFICPQKKIMQLWTHSFQYRMINFNDIFIIFSNI